MCSKELDTTEWLSPSFTCFLWLAHPFPPADKQYNICHIWRLHQRKGAAPVTGLSTDRRCLGSTVYLLHRSRQLSLQLQWLRCAGRDVWLSYSIKQSLVFLFALIWTNSYKELGTFPRFLLIPREIRWVTICISAGDNRAVSFLDTQGRTLLHLVPKADTYGESRSQRKEKGCQII